MIGCVELSIPQWLWGIKSAQKTKQYGICEGIYNLNNRLPALDVMITVG